MVSFMASLLQSFVVTGQSSLEAFDAPGEGVVGGEGVKDSVYPAAEVAVGGVECSDMPDPVQ